MECSFPSSAYCIGLQFWKISSRKFFAVLEKDLFTKGKGKRKRIVPDDASSDEEQDQVRSKKSTTRDILVEVQSLKAHIENILEKKIK